MDIKAGVKDQCVCELLPHLNKQILETRISPIFQCGETMDIILESETSFQAAGRTIMYPVCYNWTEAHMEKIVRDKRRPYFEFYDSLVTPCHETLHVVQQTLGQKDASAWALEHDASRQQLSMPAHFEKQEDMKQLLPQGLFLIPTFLVLKNSEI